jgi:hypothetical protein
MLSSLLRPKKGRRRVEHSPISSPYADQSSPLLGRQQRLNPRHATADFTETDAYDSNTEDDEDSEEAGEGEEDEEDQEDVDDEAGDEDGHEDPHLLPIFSAAHLG